MMLDFQLSLVKEKIKFLQKPQYDIFERAHGRTSRRKQSLVIEKKVKNLEQLPIPTVKYDTSGYHSDKLNAPLYEGSKGTLLQAVVRHFSTFSANNGMSKTALSMCLANEKKTLPQPNLLPSNYQEAHGLINKFLVKSTIYHCCVNDCVVFRKTFDKDFSNNASCPVCEEPRFINNTRRPRKTFSYMPVGPRLARWYGTENICKLLYESPSICNGKLGELRNGSSYRSWYQNGGVFAGMEEQSTVPLALFCDGLNPNRSMATQKSMWPLILTWLNLPIKVRQLLGPMMLVGIIPGTKTEEPKHLDPYIDILVDELLVLSESTLFNAYKSAPVSVKVALLQFQCDIPAFGKLLQVSSQAAIRGCPYCREKGIYSKTLHKVIHPSNRQFLPLCHHLRKDEERFIYKNEETSLPPKPYTNEEELEMRHTYDNLPNPSRKMQAQKESGFKGHYSLMRLPYHNRGEQMQPDGMHTIADVLSNVFDTITGKSDSKNVRLCEEQYGRFPSAWPLKRSREEDQTSESSTNKKPRQEEEEPPLPKAPWQLNKFDIGKADSRARSIQYPAGFDYHPDKHFSKPWTLRTMHGRLQFVTSNAAAWCLKGLLCPQQEKTLSFLFDVVKMLVREEFSEEDIDKITSDTHEALALIERDFPISLQTITMHLLHHIPEGFAKFGPLYGRWLFPYERVNCWITRQVLNKNRIESTVMETYAIYDWCIYVLMSNLVDHEDLSLGKFDSIFDDKTPTYSKKAAVLPENIIQNMSDVYPFALASRMRTDCLEVNIVEKEIGTTKRRVKYFTGKQSSSSYVYVRHNGKVRFGNVDRLFEHSFRDETYMWALLNLFEDPKYEDGFWSTKQKVQTTKPFLLTDISVPLVIARENNRIVFISADVM